MKPDDSRHAPDNTAAFEEIAAIIGRAREKAFRAVNRELITMYWEIGRHISGKVTADNWGKSIVQDFHDLFSYALQAYKDFLLRTSGE